MIFKRVLKLGKICVNLSVHSDANTDLDLCQPLIYSIQTDVSLKFKDLSRILRIIMKFNIFFFEHVATLYKRVKCLQ